MTKTWEEDKIRDVLQHVHDDAAKKNHDPRLGYSEIALQKLEELFSLAHLEGEKKAAKDILEMVDENSWEPATPTIDFRIGWGQFQASVADQIAKKYKLWWKYTDEALEKEERK